MNLRVASIVAVNILEYKPAIIWNIPELAAAELEELFTDYVSTRLTSAVVLLRCLLRKANVHKWSRDG
jgi:hypothetical protein